MQGGGAGRRGGRGLKRLAWVHASGLRVGEEACGRPRRHYCLLLTAYGTAYNSQQI